MNPTSQRRFRLTMFGLLYFVQGSALAYFRNFQKPYLAGLGIDADVIGLLTSILLLPFILKIFIGMFSDRVNLLGRGHRKPYIVIGLMLAAFAFAIAAFVTPDHNFMLFAAFILLGSFSVTLFDSTSDGLAIDITPKAEQGTVQGAMVSGRAAGFIVLSLVFGLLVGSQGYRSVFLIIAVVMLIPLLWVRRVREPAERPTGAQFEWRAFRTLVQPRFLLFAAFAIFYSIASFGVDGLITLHMSSSYGASDSAIGQFGALRGLGAILGALAAGVLFDRLGRKTVAYAALLLISLGAILISRMAGVNPLLLTGIPWGLAWGLQETVFVALAMGLADARIAASMFAIMMAFSNLGTAIGEGIATGLTDNIGFAAVFVALALVNLINFPILWGLFRLAPDVEKSAVEASPAT
ncbi:MAG: MFS transporter [Caldilineales bacterium]|nr:MFS transporter [Caldilineales bacterium]